MPNTGLGFFASEDAAFGGEVDWSSDKRPQTAADGARRVVCSRAFIDSVRFVV
jgi:hypothetical protein